jgi:hypothetical protein
MLTRVDMNKNSDETVPEKNSTKEIFHTLKNIDKGPTQRETFPSYAPNCRTLLKMLFIFSQFVLSNTENPKDNNLQNITLPGDASPAKLKMSGGLIALFVFIGICGICECFTLLALNGVLPRSFSKRVFNFLFDDSDPYFFSQTTNSVDYDLSSENETDKKEEIIELPKNVSVNIDLFKPSVAIKTPLPHTVSQSQETNDEMVEQSAFHP